MEGPLAQIEHKIDKTGKTRKAKIHYLHSDHLNAPRSASNEDGVVVWTWDSDAFGAGKANHDVDNDAKKVVIRLRFSGQYYDRESGLHYNHYQEYDPKTGRYIQSDPIGLNGGKNRYTYILGNPVNFIVPKGLKTCTGILLKCFDELLNSHLISNLHEIRPPISHYLEI